MSQPAPSLVPDERAMRSGDGWAERAANRPPERLTAVRAEGAGGGGSGDSPALLALLGEVRALREQLAAMSAERPGTSVRDRERLVLGRDAVLSLGRAAELLPLADGEARAWLHAHGLVATVEIGGRTKELVHWGAVLDQLKPSGERDDARKQGKRRPKRSGLPRVDLG